MRSIGKINIRKLNRILDEEYSSKDLFGQDHYDLADRVKARIPEEWYDTWESAWCEIERLISDGITRRLYSRYDHASR